MSLVRLVLTGVLGLGLGIGTVTSAPASQKTLPMAQPHRRFVVFGPFPLAIHAERVAAHWRTRGHVVQVFFDRGGWWVRVHDRW